MVRMGRRDAERFEWSREIQERDAFIRHDRHTDGVSGSHVGSLAELQGSLSFSASRVNRRLRGMSPDQRVSTDVFAGAFHKSGDTEGGERSTPSAQLTLMRVKLRNDT